MHNCGHKTRSKSSHSEKPTSHNLHPRRTARTPEPHTEPTPVQNACLAASEPSSQPQSSCRAGLQIGLPRMCTIPRYMSSRLACPCVNSRSRKVQGFCNGSCNSGKARAGEKSEGKAWTLGGFIEIGARPRQSDSTVIPVRGCAFSRHTQGIDAESTGISWIVLCVR
jgi:hypothetical protein